MPPGRDNEAGWIGYLNVQGLYKPSDKLISLLQSFEKTFSDLNGTTLMLDTDPIGKLINLLKGVKYQQRCYLEFVHFVTLNSLIFVFFL